MCLMFLLYKREHRKVLSSMGKVEETNAWLEAENFQEAVGAKVIMVWIEMGMEIGRSAM